LVKRLNRNLYLRRVCGYRDRVPTEAHFSQMKKRIGGMVLRLLNAIYVERLISLGLSI